MPVFIPFDDEAKSLLKELKVTSEVSQVLRKLQPYIVQIPQKGFESLVTAGAIQTIAPHRFEDQFWELINCDIYNEEFGMNWSDPTFIKAENSVI